MKNEHRVKVKSTSMLAKVRNMFLIVVLSLFYLTYLSIIILLSVFAEFVLYRTKYRQRIICIIKVLWLEATLAVSGFYFRRKITMIYHKEIIQKTKCLILSNHITNYDWIFMLRVLHHLGKYEDLCIVLKDSLSKLPLFGYAMKMFGFIFIKRNIERDREVLKQGVQTLGNRGSFSLLFFPEGTIINKKSHTKSRLFARENEIKVNGRRVNFKQVLVPRTTGYETINEAVYEELQGIVDITLFINPHKKYPQDSFSYKNVFLKRDVDINFIFVLKYIEKSSEILEEKFLYSLFDRKDLDIRKYSMYFSKKQPVNFNSFKSFCSSQDFYGKDYISIEIPMYTRYSKYLIYFAFFLWLFSILILKSIVL